MCNAALEGPLFPNSSKTAKGSPACKGNRSVALLHRYRGLSAVDCYCLQARIASASASDRERSLAGGLRFKRERDHTSLTGDSGGSTRPRCGDLRLAEHFVFSVNHGDDLSILREEAPIRDIHQLQHLRVVVHLDRHGVDVLCAGDEQVHGEGLTLVYLD